MAFATVWLTLFLDLLAFGIVIPVLPFYALHFEASPATVTLLSTTFSLAQFVMSPVLGRLSDTYGRRRVMLLSIGGSVGAMLVLAFAQSLWMVFLARLVSGSCNANVSTAHAYVADRVPPAERARYMGMMGSAIGLGFVVGPALGGLAAMDGAPARPFVLAAVLAAINWVLAWRFLPESHRPERGAARPVLRPWQSVAALLSMRGTVLGWLALTTFGFFFAFACMESTFALLMEDRYAWGGHETGLAFTLVGGVILVTQGLVVGRLVARVGERRTMLIGMTILATALVTVGLVREPALSVVALAFIACGNGLVSPSASAMVSRVSSADDQGLNQGLTQSAAALARILGPVAAGLVFEHVAPGGGMILGAVVVVGVAMTAAARVRLAD
jgi:MFS family permease